MSLRSTSLRLHSLSRAPLQQPLLTRAFITVPGLSNNIQRLAATRTLPYPRAALYDLVADVDAYASFVPHCSLSRVTRWSAPDAQGRRSPALADLHVGWGGFSEEFTSRLRCVPGVSVEAVSGGADGGKDGGGGNTVFKNLTTRWSLQTVAARSAMPATEVRLDVEYQFANPLYAAVSAAVSDKVATTMIEAFEEQARERLGEPRRSAELAR